LLALLGASHVGCAVEDDIGEPCEELQADAADPNANPTQTDEFVAQQTDFHCRERICIATDGRPGYCSKKCISDASCPSGFECREIIPAILQSDGVPFAGETFCAWKRCEGNADCGTREQGPICCEPALGVEPGKEIKLCNFSESKCEP